MTCENYCEVRFANLDGRLGLLANCFLPDDEGNESSRPLGLVVARGTLLVLISPVDGSEEIANPFDEA